MPTNDSGRKPLSAASMREAEDVVTDSISIDLELFSDGNSAQSEPLLS